MTWVKICGLSDVKDAITAVNYGVNALGFIFAESQRTVSPKEVKEIISRIREKVEKVGVFMNQPQEYVRMVAEYCELDSLQFHGKEAPDYCLDFNDFTVIKAFRVNRNTGWDEIKPYVEKEAIDRILLDTFIKGVPGGTGQTFPWDLVKEKHTWGNVPVIIAGGITPTNVSELIIKTKPFGIDVGSGVELEPRKKDSEKLKELLNRINKAS